MSRTWQLIVLTPPICMRAPERTRWAEYGSIESGRQAAEKLMRKPYGAGSSYCVSVVGAVLTNTETFEVGYRGYRKSLRVRDNDLYANLFLFGGEKDARKWTMVDDGGALQQGTIADQVAEGL